MDSCAKGDDKSEAKAGYFAFTQTINVKCLGRFTATQQYDKTATFLHDVLRLNKFIGLTIVCELTEAGNLHYHGFFRYPNQCLDRVNYIWKNVMKKHPKEFGFSKIKLVDDHKGWVQYLIKDLKKTMDLIGRFPIISDHDDLLGQDNLVYGGRFVHEGP